MGTEDECFFPLLKIPFGFAPLKPLKMLSPISTDPGTGFLLKQLIHEQTIARVKNACQRSKALLKIIFTVVFLWIKLHVNKEEPDQPGVRDTSVTRCFTAKNLWIQEHRPNTFLCVKPLGVTCCWPWKSPLHSGIPLKIIYEWPQELSNNLSLPRPVDRVVV